MAKHKMIYIESLKNRDGYLFLMPALLVLVAVLIVPLFSSLVLSFIEWNYMDPESVPKFVGIQNYIHTLTNPQDINSFKVTFSFMSISIALELLLGISIALLLNGNLRGLKVFRSLIIMPMMIAEVVASLCWRYMLQSDFGIVNYFLKVMHIGAQAWTDQNHALISIILMEVWQNTPFVILIILAALQSLPSDTMEAADVDGANYFQKLFAVVFPVIRPQILIVLVFRTMFALRAFTQPWVLTGGGPADKTLVLGIDIYRKAFRYYDMGLANSLSWILIFVTICIVIAYIALLDKEDYS